MYDIFIRQRHGRKSYQHTDILNRATERSTKSRRNKYVYTTDTVTVQS